MELHVSLHFALDRVSDRAFPFRAEDLVADQLAVFQVHVELLAV